MTVPNDAPLIMSLEDFAEAVAADRRRCYLDTLPEDVQQQIIDAPVSVATASAWLASLGYESTGIESWRRKRRAERDRRTNA